MLIAWGRRRMCLLMNQAYLKEREENSYDNVLFSSDLQKTDG